jgi:mersacidin/lichenicidin family type 2 lantibiotic
MNRRKFFSLSFGMIGLGLFASKTNANVQLSPEEIVKAWQDPSFRNSLSKKQWEALPPNPAGEIRSGEFKGNVQLASGNSCSGNSCSGNSCSGNSCSGSSCSGNSCSGNSCSGNSCSGNSCSGNSCSGNRC